MVFQIYRPIYTELKKVFISVNFCKTVRKGKEYLLLLFSIYFSLVFLNVILDTQYAIGSNNKVGFLGTDVVILKNTQH